MPIVMTSAKGQVVIPKAIRKALDIKPRSRLHVRLEGKEVVLFPLADDPIRGLRGILKGGPSLTKALLEDRKEDLKREEKSVLDSFAILAWLQNEQGSDRVEALLTQAQRRKTFFLLNVISLGEVYYRLAMQHGHPLAQTIIRQFETVPIQLYPCDHDLGDHNLVIEAAKIKADYPMAYADAFAVATAMKEDAVIITGDPEFRQVGHLVTIDWV